MKITRIIEKSIRLQSNISNAFVNFGEHTVSLIAVVTDQQIGGKPLVGLAFNSIGRFAQSGIIRDRMIPRLMAADPAKLLSDDGQAFDPSRVLRCLMANEKPGGHGDRAHAAAALELAIWDLNAKLRREPAANTIANHFGLTPLASVPVYAAGGYYYPEETDAKLIDELKRYKDQGFTRFKIKVGGASLERDRGRVENALRVSEGGKNLAVDANGRLSLEQSLEYAALLEPYDLMWFEEAGDPQDFELHRQLTEAYRGATATGENLFSSQDVKNLALFGGMRQKLDVFQMDAGLSYGVTGYARMLQQIEALGFSRKEAYPHGGQLLSMHVVAGLGLGGCELYPQVFQPLGGLEDGAKVANGYAQLSDAPGFGLERKYQLIHEFTKMLG